MCSSCLVCVKSELCAKMLEQNVAGMQVFSATVGRLGPKWVKPCHKWVKTGSNVGQKWVTWVTQVMSMGLWVMWILRCTGQVNMCKMAIGATGF